MTALGAVLDQVVQPDENFHDLIVFLHPTLLQPGDEVRPAFPDDLGEGGLAVEAPSYFFWIDHAPMAYFAKPNQFVLVDAETFAVTESAEMFWPLLNGVGLFTDAAAYRDPCNWAFARFDALGPPPQLGTPAGQAAARGLRVSQFDGLPSQICGLVVDGGAAGEPSRADMAASAAIMAMALTDFGYTRVDTVGPPNNTPAAFEAAIRDISMRPGCEQITIYVTAHAATDTLILGGQEYSAAAFAVHLEGASPLDFFNVILDTSRAGTFRDDLSVIERRGRAEGDVHRDRNRAVRLGLRRHRPARGTGGSRRGAHRGRRRPRGCRRRLHQCDRRRPGGCLQRRRGDGRAALRRDRGSPRRPHRRIPQSRTRRSGGLRSNVLSLTFSEPQL